MARFKYLGEKARTGLVIAYGPCQKIRLRLKDGTTTELTPVAPATEFVADVDIGYNINDERTLRALRADPRFAELP